MNWRMIRIVVVVVGVVIIIMQLMMEFLMLSIDHKWIEAHRLIPKAARNRMHHRPRMYLTKSASCTRTECRNCGNAKRAWRSVRRSFWGKKTTSTWTAKRGLKSGRTNCTNWRNGSRPKKKSCSNSLTPPPTLPQRCKRKRKRTTTTTTTTMMADQRIQIILMITKATRHHRTMMATPEMIMPPQPLPLPIPFPPTNQKMTLCQPDNN
mmetsp:Transcript_5123/g.14997  ORF Transcript_5123/g.14997 Transcript_5123/m.14997 type:complete len:208 (+) Transcript_5123:1964-2587(+)